MILRRALAAVALACAAAPAVADEDDDPKSVRPIDAEEERLRARVPRVDAEEEKLRKRVPPVDADDERLGRKLPRVDEEDERLRAKLPRVDEEEEKLRRRVPRVDAGEEELRRKVPIVGDERRVRVELVGGGAVEGRVIAEDAESITVDGGAFRVRIRRADVLAVDGKQAPAAAAPSRIRAGAFVHLAVLPRLAVGQRCLFVDAAGDCFSPFTQVGYAASVALGVGYAVRRRLLVGVEGTIGAANVGGEVSAVADVLAVARWIAVGGLFLELGAGVGVWEGRAGLALREGIGFELALGRAVSFAPALAATEQFGPAFARLTVEAQLALRYYF